MGRVRAPEHAATSGHRVPLLASVPGFGSSTPLVPRSLTEPLPCVAHQGRDYATLCGARPADENVQQEQIEFLALPDGWELAPGNADVVAEVIGKHPWGTAELVTADGKSWVTGHVDRLGAGFVRTRQESLLVEGNGRYRPGGRDTYRRILIRRFTPGGGSMTLRREDFGEGGAAEEDQFGRLSAPPQVKHYFFSSCCALNRQRCALVSDEHPRARGL